MAQVHTNKSFKSLFSITFGTLFGLQSNGRIESILVSMPPLASWHYRFEPAEGTPEFELTDYYLKPRDWLAL